MARQENDAAQQEALNNDAAQQEALNNDAPKAPQQVESDRLGPKIEEVD